MLLLLLPLPPLPFGFGGNKELKVLSAEFKVLRQRKGAKTQSAARESSTQRKRVNTETQREKRDWADGCAEAAALSAAPTHLTIVFVAVAVAVAVAEWHLWRRPEHFEGRTALVALVFRATTRLFVAENVLFVAQLWHCGHKRTR